MIAVTRLIQPRSRVSWAGRLRCRLMLVCVALSSGISPIPNGWIWQVVVPILNGSRKIMRGAREEWRRSPNERNYFGRRQGNAALPTDDRYQQTAFARL